MSEQPFSHSPHVNPGLARDRAALLEARDTLAGTACLNWSEEIAMHDWQGITLRGSLPRVTELDLSFSKLNGSIPSKLGSLTVLRVLNLEGNHLTGEIPGELGDLRSLRRLNLRNNGLTGSIPVELGKLGNLMFLSIGGNVLKGRIPFELIKRLKESLFFRERGRKIMEARRAERDLWYEYDDPRYYDEFQKDLEYADDEGMREWEEEIGDWFGWPWTNDDNYNREAPG